MPGKARRRWEMVARLLLGLDWTRVELLDAKGALLHTIDAEVEAAPSDDVGDSIERALGKAPTGLDKEHGFLLLMMKAQEVVLKHQSSMMSTVVEGNKALTGMVLARLEHLEATFGKTLQLAHDAAQRVAQASGQGGGPGDAEGADAAIIEMLKVATAGGGMTEAKIEAIVERAGRKLLGMGGVATAPPTKAAAPSNGEVKGA